jgi:DNA-binding LacI/PurR family transcriptional regulator
LHEHFGFATFTQSCKKRKLRRRRSGVETKRRGRLNQADIAGRLGVSVSTVSRALANDAGISATVRQDIQALARTLGYKGKRALDRTGNWRATVFVGIGSATSGLSGFYLDIVEGMRSTAADSGLALDIKLVNESAVSFDVIRRHAEQSGSNGLLLAGIDATDEFAAWCTAAEVPVVLVNGSDPAMQLSSVSPANYYGAFQATQRLLDAGHRKLLHFTHKSRPTILQRRRGFEAAVAATPGAKGLVINSDEMRVAEFSRRLVAGEFDATALFAWNDVVAVELLDAIGAGSKLPEQFSLIGFDDLPIASFATPRLSTMRVNRTAIAEGAIRLLHQQIAGDRTVQHLEIGVRPVEGGTIHRLKGRAR